MIYKVLMFGTVEWSNVKAVRREVKKLKKKYGTTHLLIISGGAPGADIISEMVAHEENIHVARVDALWSTRHKAAGPQRNEVMKELEPDEAIGFHPDIKKGRGSKDMYKRLLKADIPVRIVSK